jgi:hypothetical protein
VETAKPITNQVRKRRLVDEGPGSSAGAGASNQIKGKQILVEPPVVDPRFGGRRLVMGLAAVKPEIKEHRFGGRTIVMGLAAVKIAENKETSTEDGKKKGLMLKKPLPVPWEVDTEAFIASFKKQQYDHVDISSVTMKNEGR